MLTFYIGTSSYFDLFYEGYHSQICQVILCIVSYGEWFTMIYKGLMANLHSYAFKNRTAYAVEINS